MSENIIPIRKQAVIIGALFIIALFLAPVASSFIDPAITHPDWLLTISNNANQVKIGALLLFAAALCSVSISIWLYPILKKYNQGLALTAIVFRSIEAVFYTISAVGLLSLIGLAQDYAKIEHQALATYQAIGNYILLAREVSGFVFAVIAFSLGGLAYYYIFYKSRLIPRWLSIWGLLSCLTLLAAVFVSVINGPPFAISETTTLLAAPIALQELVLGIWLIVKGFNTNVINERSSL